MLCVATMTAGIVHVRNRPEPASTAVRVGQADGLSPASAGGAPPSALGAMAAPPAPISLADLARQIRPRPTTSTTRPRASTTTTTTKKATAKPTSTTTTTSAKTAASPAPSTTTTTAVPGTPLTTLLEKVVPPAAAVTGAITHTDSGVASWFKAAEGTCAHRTLALGTMVKVTGARNGASATCKVNDRGPTVETGRLIDLSVDVFERLADRDAGLIDVRIEW